MNTKIPVKTGEDLFEAVENFTTTVQDAAWKSTPDRKHSKITEDNPIYIKEALVNKGNLRKQWQISRHPNDKTKLNQAT